MKGEKIFSVFSELIEKLEKKGIKKGKIDKQNKNWIWGINHTERMNHDDFYSVYLYHLYKLKNFGSFYKDYIFEINEILKY